MKVNTQKILCYFIVIIVAPFAVHSCAKLTPEGAIIPTESNPTPLFTSLTTPTLTTQSATSNPTSSPIVTITPSAFLSATSTHTLSNAPTKIPPTRMTDAEIEKKVLDLFKTNAGCQLPCWWGITPGRTTWSEAEELLQPLATEIISGNSNAIPQGIFYGVLVDVPESDANLGINEQIFRVKDNEIRVIEVYPVFTQKYSVANILSDYGAPTNILLKTYNQPREGSLPFRLLLFYRNLGFMAFYEVSGRVTGNTVVGCFEHPERTSLLLWPASENYSLEKIASLGASYYILEEAPSFRRIEEVSDLTLQSFYEKFKEKPDACIETSKEQWPFPR